MSLLFKLYQSSVLRYVIIRYLTYAIQFGNSVLLISLLSKDDFGIYSFVLLLFSYYTYTIVGLNSSVNTLLSVYKNRILLTSKIWSVSLGLFLIYGGITSIVCISALLIFPGFLDKFQYSTYAVNILIIGLLVNLNLLFVSMYRVFGNFFRINLQQILPQATLFLIALYLGKNISVKAIVTILAGAHFLVFLFMLYKSPLSLKPAFNRTVAKVLFFRGLNLMLYGFSFQYITLAATTIVSIFYSKAELGYYSFANVVANAVVMVTASFMFILYPKMLHIFANRNLSESFSFIKKVRSLYTLAVDLVALSSLLVLPLVFILSPSHLPILNTFKILIAAQIILNNTSGFIQFLIAKKREGIVTIYGIAGVITVVFAGVTVSFTNLPFFYLAFCVFFGINLYTLSVVKLGLKNLGEENTILSVIRQVYSYKKILVLFLIFLSVYIDDNLYLPVLAILIYILLNLKEIVILVKESVALFSNNQMVNI